MYKQFIHPEKGQPLCCVLFKAAPELKGFSAGSKCFTQWKFKAKRKCRTLHNAWHLWLKKRAGRKARCSRWLDAGCIRPPGHSGQPHYAGDSARSSRRIYPLAPSSRQQADFGFHLEHYRFITRHVTFQKNLSQLHKQASPGKHRQTKTCGHPYLGHRTSLTTDLNSWGKGAPDQRSRQQTGLVQWTFP